MRTKTAKGAGDHTLSSLNTCLQGSSLQRAVLGRGNQTLTKSSCPRILVLLKAPRKSDCSDPFSDIFCASIAKPTLLWGLFSLVQTSSPPQTGGTSMLQTKVYVPHVVFMFCRKSKCTKEESSGRSTQAC